MYLLRAIHKPERFDGDVTARFLLLVATLAVSFVCRLLGTIFECMYISLWSDDVSRKQPIVEDHIRDVLFEHGQGHTEKRCPRHRDQQLGRAADNQILLSVLKR